MSVITNDGRQIVGVLRGYDQVRRGSRVWHLIACSKVHPPWQVTNVILEDCHERVYSTKVPSHAGFQLTQLIRCPKVHDSLHRPRTEWCGTSATGALRHSG